VSGASYATLLAMALALLLRVCVVVAMPGIAAYAAVMLAREGVRRWVASTRRSPNRS
jgi:hypothetical protein